MRIARLLLRFGGWFLLALALLLLCTSLVTYLDACSFLRSAVRTQGSVTALVPMDDEDVRSVFGDPTTNFPGPYFSYGYLFRDLDGMEHRAVSSSGSSPAEYKIGDMVAVIYPPRHPEKAELEKHIDRWYIPTIVTQVAILFACFGSLLVLSPKIIRRFHREPDAMRAG